MIKQIKTKKTHRNQQNAKQTKAQEQEEESQEGTSSLLHTNRTFLGFEALMVYKQMQSSILKILQERRMDPKISHILTELSVCLSVCLTTFWKKKKKKCKWIAFA